jgi:putative spermidine/putrescine transport system ATP-binding protein
VTHDQEEALTMSDRLAVVNNGRIEQVGAPAEIYEHPATAFVAGFVGISNLLRGPAAQAITGSPAPFTIRPEKIRMVAPDSVAIEGTHTAIGRIRDVVYLGMHTRYQVALDGGGELTVVAQNLDDSSNTALAARDRPVRLIWQREHSQPVGGASGA